MPYIFDRTLSARGFCVRDQIASRRWVANPNLAPPTVITGIPMLDALIEGNVPYFLSSLQHTILPSLTLALVSFGVIVRVLRSSMLKVMHANYNRTAKAKGLDQRTVFFKHALRNAMISVVTLSSLIVTWLITGTNLWKTSLRIQALASMSLPR